MGSATAMLEEHIACWSRVEQVRDAYAAALDAAAEAKEAGDLDAGHGELLAAHHADPLSHTRAAPRTVDETVADAAAALRDSLQAYGQQVAQLLDAEVRAVTEGRWTR